METPAADRLAKLLGTSELPARPSANQQTFAEQELTAMVQRSAMWKIPETAQYPRKIQGLPPKLASGGDIYTSSEDEDDYVAAFQKKPKMISTQGKAKPQQLCQVGNGSFGTLTCEHGDRSTVIHDLPKMTDQGSPATGHFCQFALVAKFPYKYMTDEDGRVSRHFFANQKFYERTWDLYYLHQPESLPSNRPLLLVPYHQVQTLIDEISTVFNTEVRVPVDPFTLSFFDDGTPQPIFLGTAMSRADVCDLRDSIPFPPKGHGEAPHNCSENLDRSFAAFKAKVERAQAAEKRKKAATKRKKTNDRFLAMQDWSKQLRRAQRYLGVSPEPFQIQAPPLGLSWEEQDAFIQQQEKHSAVIVDPLDVNEPTTHDFHKTPIIVSLDIESYERAHDIITEVGISTLDTLDLVVIAPGEGGEEWMKQIRSRHFRIKGRETYVNKDFCIGDGNAFQFGKSEWVDFEDVGDVIDSCFEWPFSVQYRHNGKLSSHSGPFDEGIERATNRARDDRIHHDNTTQLTGPHDDEAGSNTHSHDHVNLLPSPAEENAFRPSTNNCDTDSNTTSFPNPITSQRGPKERTILLVGHDLQGDLAYLSKLNSAIFSEPRDGATQYPPRPSTRRTSDSRATRGAHILSCILEALDTSTLFKALFKEQNKRSLSSIMAEVGRSALYSHNGGNDARYTLEALVGLVIKARLMDDEDESTRQKDLDAAQVSAWETETECRVSE